MINNNIKKTALLTLFLLIGVLIGLGLNYYYRTYISSPEGGSIKELRQNGYKFIKPLLECTGQESITTKVNLEIKDNLSDIINNSPDIKTSIYFRDLNNGPWFGINEKDKFMPASLLKVPILIAALKQAESDPKLLDKEITIEKASNSFVQEFSKEKLKKGDIYKLSDLLEFMIKYSDNDAKDAVMNNIDLNILQKTFDDLGVIINNNEVGGDFMNAVDYSSFFRILYNGSFLNKEMSEYALKMLSNSAFENGLKAGLPDYITISHKYGERESIINGNTTKQLHDCGIIYNPDKPYVLCIMTKGNDYLKQADLIKNISAKTYQIINQDN